MLVGNLAPGVFKQKNVCSAALRGKEFVKTVEPSHTCFAKVSPPDIFSRMTHFSVGVFYHAMRYPRLAGKRLREMNSLLPQAFEHPECGGLKGDHSK